MAQDFVQQPYKVEQVASGFTSVEFADNPEPRCPCLLLLDTSGSMGGAPISQLNAAIKVFKDELVADPLAAKRVEVAIITFGDAPHLEQDFVDVLTFQPQAFSASGTTAMGASIEDGIRRLTERKDTYRQNGIAYYRPWVFLVTDGAPTDSWQRAAQDVRQGEDNGAFSFFAVGVSDANFEVLNQIASPSRPAVKLDGLRFRDLFIWLSKSLKAVSKSTRGTQVQLDAPGWTTAVS